MKSTRFTAVVQACGSPVIANLWTEPKADQAFMKAVRQNRVLTVNLAGSSSRSDYGAVGFHPGKRVAYFIFPKPLTPFNGHRIIGIHYELLTESPPLGPLVKQRFRGRPAFDRRQARRPELAPVPSETREKNAPGNRYLVTVRFTAVADVSEEVFAASSSAAREEALKTAQPPNLSKATITKRIARVTVL